MLVADIGPDERDVRKLPHLDVPTDCFHRSVLVEVPNLHQRETSEAPETLRLRRVIVFRPANNQQTAVFPFFLPGKSQCFRHGGETAQHIDSATDKTPQRALLGVIFFVKEEHRPVETADESQVAPCALAFVVQEAFGEVDILVASQFYLVGKVDVLAVHEVAFVQIPCPLQRLAPHEHKSPCQHFDLVLLVGREVGQRVLGVFRRFGEELRQTGKLAKRYPGRRERALALAEEHAVAVQHLQTHRADLGTLVHIVNQRPQTVLADYGVRIEHQHIFAPSSTECLVVCTRKAGVVRIRDELHVRELGLEIRQRAVRRGVIDHEDLQAVHPARGGLDGEQALLQEIFDVVIDDDNGEDNFLSLHNILFIHRRLYDNIICVHWEIYVCATTYLSKRRKIGDEDRHFMSHTQKILVFSPARLFFSQK